MLVLIFFFDKWKLLEEGKATPQPFQGAIVKTA